MIELLKFTENHLPRTFEWMQIESLKNAFLLDKNITIESHRKWFDSIGNDESQCIFAIMFDNIHVGNIGLKHIDYHNKNAEVWIYVAENSYRGKGIAKNALILLDGIFNDRFIKLYSRVADSNIASIKSFQSADYNIEGIFRREVIFKDEIINIIRFYKFI